MKSGFLLHSPLGIGSGPRRRHLQNRVVLPPMASQTGSADGYVTEETLAHYARLVESGVGLAFVEYTYVSDSGRSEDRQLGISADAHTVGLARIARILHDAGAVAGLQITHALGKSSVDLTGGVLLGPSRVPVPVKDETLAAPTPMTLAQIRRLKVDFVAAARRARTAGFDLIELHCAHGYGLNQWLSPLTNKRTDAYGGSLSARARLLLEIVREIRAAVPELLIAARIPGQDFLEGGLTRQDMTEVAQWLRDAGVDLLDVSSGLGGWRRPKERRGEGYLVDEASWIQSSVDFPVIGVGGIETPQYIERALCRGDVSLTAVGRAILKDPRAWRQKMVKEKFVCS
ncbi:MAG: oxidoreductase [Bdellovibrionota bacterium]